MDYKNGKYRKSKRFLGKPWRRMYIKYLLVLAVVLVFCVLLGQYAREQAIPETDGDYVQVEELAGYLQVIPLTPEETRALIVEQIADTTDDGALQEIEDMGETASGKTKYLTAGNVKWLFLYLALGEMPETVTEALNTVGNGYVSRETWSIIFEEMLSILGLADEVEILEIQYLGMLLEDGHLMADSGNYECDTESIDFVYGESYWVYVWGNVLLGRAVQENETAAEENGEEMEQNTADDSGVTLPETVRVLLTQDNGGSIYRENVYVKGETDLLISVADSAGASAENSGSETIAAGAMVDCLAWMNKTGVAEMYVSSSGSTGVLTDGRISITDSGGDVLASGYTGTFHIYKDENGLCVVNETSLEAYLCGVVPGEMPKSFATEALKAQAVCARTYAARLVSEKKYEQYGADLNDTTDCQVFLPSAENEEASGAVAATAGQVLIYDGSLATIYYFSTSCGLTSGLEVWGTEGLAYLQSVSLLTDAALSETVLAGSVSLDDFLRRTDVAAYDSHSRFFRWTATLDMGSRLTEVKAALQAEINKGTGRVGVEDTSGEGISSVDKLGTFSGMEVVSRNTAGMVTDLLLVFEKGRVHIYHENAIRTVLGTAMTALTDKNGESVTTMTMLPSAAFSVETAEGQITLYGGGLGHGIGMSQYGADGMAQGGKGYAEILGTFFPGSKVQGN